MMRRLEVDGMLALALAGIILLLAITVGWQVATGGAHRGSDRVPPSEVAKMPELPDVFSMPELALDTFSEISERPVFSPSRRPAASPSRISRPVPASDRSADLELVGLVSEGARRLALVRPRGSQETVQLAEGETYRDWTVAEIGADFVRVQAGGTEFELRLAYKPQ